MVLRMKLVALILIVQRNSRLLPLQEMSRKPVCGQDIRLWVYPVKERPGAPEELETRRQAPDAAQTCAPVSVPVSVREFGMF